MRTRKFHGVVWVFVALMSLSFQARGASDGTCGEPITMKGKDGAILKARQFKDGSLAVRAPLAVNPDGGPGSYTVGDHGFTYIANGLDRWRHGARETCDRACAASFKLAEKAGFAKGTEEFCVFAMEVEALQSGMAPTKCTNGLVIGNGKGRPVTGVMLDTVTGDKVRAYLSTTSLRHLVNGIPTYLNAEALPIAVTPRSDLLGKVVWVAGNGMHGTFALIGDKGPAFGEGSIALHQLLRTGSATPQKSGPIPAGGRCIPEEIGLQPPFESRPNDPKDRCKPGYKAHSDSDIRAYAGIQSSLDFVIIGPASFERTGNTIKMEVTPDTISGMASKAGYSADMLEHLRSCLAD